MLGRLAQFSSMIQATPCASRESGEQRGVSPQTTERSRNDAAQRHWKVFDDTSFFVYADALEVKPTHHVVLIMRVTSSRTTRHQLSDLAEW